MAQASAEAVTGCKLEEEEEAAAAEERSPEIQTSFQWRETSRVEYITTEADASSAANGNPERVAADAVDREGSRCTRQSIGDLSSSPGSSVGSKHREWGGVNRLFFEVKLQPPISGKSRKTMT